MIITKLQDGVVARTTTIIKQLTLQDGKCKHTNTVRVSKVRNGVCYHTPQIVNSVDRDNDHAVRRTFELSYLDKKYYIIDLFDYTILAEQSHYEENPVHQLCKAKVGQLSPEDHGMNISHSEELENDPNLVQSKKKLCLFRKKIQGEISLKRNTKNVPKNFCKAFAHFMISKKNGSNQWLQASKQFQRLQKRSRYNNILIQNILSNPIVNPYFKEFLLTYAEDWIASSKVVDKDIHFEAITIYLQLLSKLALGEDAMISCGDET